MYKSNGNAIICGNIINEILIIVIIELTHLSLSLGHF